MGATVLAETAVVIEYSGSARGCSHRSCTMAIATVLR